MERESHKEVAASASQPGVAQAPLPLARFVGCLYCARIRSQSFRYFQAKLVDVTARLATRCAGRRAIQRELEPIAI